MRESLVYAKPSPDGALWMPILEKAAAKMYGNYEVMVAGWMGPAISMLTGSPFFDVNHVEKSVDDLWDYIDERLKMKYMVTCGSKVGTGSDQDQNAIGVPYRHAFTVPATLKLNDGTKLIQVRNPWGKETFKGDWSDSSAKWTEAIKNEVGDKYKIKNDGLWWINAKDYHESFDSTTINPNIVDYHQTYFALFDVKRDEDHTDMLSLKSDVDQTIYMSAHMYS